ncbi:tetratricopeptide repeat protein 37-like [Amphiura filiformis]|uniref:tetratricopeptide repeat protein 37-like n=1 Tax=Amphiura filiformis TaxID=82378 RepID=UPI003B213815
MNYHSQSRHSSSENVQFPFNPILAREPSRSVATPIREQWPNRPVDTQGGNSLHQFGAIHVHSRSCNIQNALEHYQTGNYLAAMRMCKTLLASNSSNYEAQLLLGCSLTSYKMLPSAEEAFRAAIKINERDYRGWKSLSDILEHNGARTLVLFDIYLTILTLARPNTKEEWDQMFEKAMVLHTQLGGKDTIHLKLRNLKVFSGYPDFDGIVMSKWRDLIYSFPAKITSKVDESIMRAACWLVKDSVYSNKLDQMKCDILLSMTCKERHVWTEVEAKCLRMQKVFPSDKFPLKILAKHYIKSDMGCINDKTIQIYHDLFKTDQQSALAAIGIGQTRLAQKKYESAKTWLLKGVAADEQNVYGWLYLAQAQLATKDVKEAHKSALKGLELVKDKPISSSTKSVRSQLELCRAKSAAGASVTKASSANSTRSKVGLSPSQTTEVIDPNLATLASLVESIPLQSLKKATPTDLYKKLIQVCKRIHSQRHRGPEAGSLRDWRRGNRADYNLQHAIKYWDNSMETRTDPWMFLTSILKALKHDPWNADVFFRLGKYICEVLAEISLGQEFVELSYNLQPDGNTGSYLIDICMVLQEKTKAVQILVSGLRSSPNAKWAWLRLGLIQMSGCEYSQAETSLWNAINGDSRSNRQAYECLGRSRLRMGLKYDSLTAFVEGARLQPHPGFMTSISDSDVTSLEAVDLRAIYSDTTQWTSCPQETGVQFAFSLLYAICPELLRPIGYNFNTVHQARKAITNSYGNGGLCHAGQRIHWGEPDKQCAYMIRFFLIHCQFVPWLLRCTPNILTKFPAGNHLRVCCIGGGPGSDIIGLITFLRSINRNTRLTCHILDKYPDWNKVWKTIQPRLPPPAVNASYLPLDITSSNPLDSRIVEAIRNADIVTFVKSVSPAVAFIKDPPPLNQKYPFMPIQSQRGAIPTILRTLKSGALVVYIDNQQGDQNKLFRSMAVSEGLKLIRQNVWRCDIKANAAEYNAVWNNFSCLACESCSVHGIVFYKP